MSDWAGRMEVLKPPAAPPRRITVKVTRQSRLTASLWPPALTPYLKATRHTVKPDQLAME